MRLQAVYDLIDRPDLKCQPYVPYMPPAFSATTTSSHHPRAGPPAAHPYDSFSPVVDFVSQAAVDPKVLAIKLTLYRTSSDSPIVKALIEAAHNNKQVTALIELKARFDEANNINWARQLEEAGVHVVYGFVGLKTHCKCCLVVRREEDGIRRYAHLGTGNYHSKTAKLYTDLSFFTARPDVTDEVAETFNTLTGFARSPKFKTLLVAPTRCTRRCRSSSSARRATPAPASPPASSSNATPDRQGNDRRPLRGLARRREDRPHHPRHLRVVPGVPGMSDNIRVRSILGRYLEHSRIYYFENAGDPDIYLGSADWMPRNFYRRIEVVFPVTDDRLRMRIHEEILETTLRDTTAKELRPNGAYEKLVGGNGEYFSSQDYFMRLAEQRARGDEEARQAEELETAADR
jgi:polyphosphate kinase